MVTFYNVAIHDFSKISQVREGGSQNLGTVPKLYLVVNYDGFLYLNVAKKSQSYFVCCENDLVDLLK